MLPLRPGTHDPGLRTSSLTRPQTLNPRPLFEAPMPLPDHWYYYLKPASLPAVICALAGAALILYIPDPLWALRASQVFNAYDQGNSIPAALLFLLWVALHASCWLILMRAWRYHAHLGVPISRHAFPLPFFAASITFSVWLFISLVVWLGIRSAAQDYLQNPWFPLLRQSEYAMPLAWLKVNLCLFFAWLAIWSRWHTPYRQSIPLVVIVLLWHIMAMLMLGSDTDRWSIGLVLLLIATLIPIPRQLRDMEAL